MFIFLYVIIASTTASCGVKTLIYGPECTSPRCFALADKIVYNMDEIDPTYGDTYLECMGWAYKRGKKNDYDWHPSGIMKKGDESPGCSRISSIHPFGDESMVSWTRRPDLVCPKIKCKGKSSSTTFQWSWDAYDEKKVTYCGQRPIKFHERKKIKCCGETIYDPNIHQCCPFPSVYLPTIRKLNEECFPDLL